MSGHHRFGPSTLGLRDASPCYRPKNDSNKHTDRGTVLHTAMENLSDEGVSHHDDWAFYEVIGKLKSLGLLKEDGEFTFEGKKEVRLDLFHDEEELLYGTADLLLFDGISNEIFLVDYKFGSWPVPPPSENLQLQAYAAAALQAYPDFKKCNLFILQPGHDYPEHTMTQADADATAVRVARLIERCKETYEHEELYPSTKACMFCARFVGCPGPVGMFEDLL